MSEINKINVNGVTYDISDTHYTTNINAGASGTNSNSAATNPFIKIKDDSTYRNQIRLIGTGSIGVSSDANGNITISGSNTVPNNPTITIANDYEIQSFTLNQSSNQTIKLPTNECINTMIGTIGPTDSTTLTLMSMYNKHLFAMSDDDSFYEFCLLIVTPEYDATSIKGYTTLNIPSNISGLTSDYSFTFRNGFGGNSAAENWNVVLYKIQQYLIIIRQKQAYFIGGTNHNPLSLSAGGTSAASVAQLNPFINLIEPNLSDRYGGVQLVGKNGITTTSTTNNIINLSNNVVAGNGIGVTYSGTNNATMSISQNYIGTCTSSAATEEKTVTLANFSLTQGTMITVNNTNTNTADVANIKLNVNGTGAKNIKMRINNSIVNLPTTAYFHSGSMVFVYDNTYWLLLSNQCDNNTTYSTATTSNNGLMSTSQVQTLGKLSEVLNPTTCVINCEGNYTEVYTAINNDTILSEIEASIDKGYCYIELIFNAASIDGFRVLCTTDTNEDFSNCIIKIAKILLGDHTPRRLNYNEYKLHFIIRDAHSDYWRWRAVSSVSNSYNNPISYGNVICSGATSGYGVDCEVTFRYFIKTKTIYIHYDTQVLPA